MSVHGQAPGPGYALVVHRPGFPPVRSDTPAWHLTLSGEGVLSCVWLALNPHWRPPPEQMVVGEYVRLPMTAGLLRELRTEADLVLAERDERRRLAGR